MKRQSVAVLTLLSLIVGGGGLAAAGAIILPGIGGPGLAAVGPVSATDGFPVWYKDKAGLRLENCISSTDPLCPARGPLPDENAPLSFPDNYPDEGFYSLASANLTTAPPDPNALKPLPGKALAEVALEQAFRGTSVTPGDQITFARVRLKLVGARDNVNYTITSPAGVKTLQTSKPGLIFDTEDIGIGSPGDFSGALGGRVGPFLTWDTYPNDPALVPVAGKDTYVGDGATPHKITGSPYGSNIFRIEGPGVNPGLADACPTVAGPVADCVETDLFSVQGKLATTSGVTAEQAVYSRSTAGVGTVDVFASSETGPQAIQVSDASPGTKEFDPTGLAGSEGHFFTRVGYTGAQPPTAVQVSNTGDVPVSSKVINVVDGVSGKASFNTDTQLLTVNAVSSDTVGSRVLKVSGYGSLSAGTFISGALAAPPLTVTVTSDANGSAVLPVEVTGSARAAIPVVAQAGPDQSVSTGQLVTLDGSASVGATTFAWTSPAGITLASATTANPTFTPSSTGTFVFSLTVTGPGGPSTSSVSITVNAATKAIADAGTDQNGVRRGTKVTLDGSRSIGASIYTWTQTSGTPVTALTGANTAQPTFTFPMFKYSATNTNPSAPLTFNLLVQSPDGSSANDSVNVTPSVDALTIARAQFTASKAEWRVDGTSSVLGAGQTVTVHLGGLNGTVLGTAVVDVTGAFSMRNTTTGIVGRVGQTVSVESQLGGTSSNFTIRVQ
jgi:hypothetical protein